MKESDVLSIVAGASNIKSGTNPPFTKEDLYAMYPQFGVDSEGNQAIPETMIEMYIEVADNLIKETRFHKSWKLCMCLCIAHFLTLYVQGLSDLDSGTEGILKAGTVRGLDTSVSVGDVSVSTDYSLTVSNISGYEGWKLTSYGQQLITFAKMYGKGGMMIR